MDVENTDLSGAFWHTNRSITGSHCP